ncbi:hypothetical protein ACWIUD_07505 [Helicobacter sp. 23-1044]
MRESYGAGGNYAKAKGKVDFYKIAESALKSLQDSAICTLFCHFERVKRAKNLEKSCHCEEVRNTDEAIHN